jgi:hypothetical protein
MTIESFVAPWPFFSFILYTVGRTPWTSNQPVARPLAIHRTTQTQNKRTQTSMPPVESEPTIPAFERAKIVRSLERAATAIAMCMIIDPEEKYPASLKDTSVPL